MNILSFGRTFYQILDGINLNPALATHCHEFFYSSVWLMFYSAYRVDFEFKGKFDLTLNKYVKRRHFLFMQKNKLSYGSLVQKWTELQEKYDDYLQLSRLTSKGDKSFYRDDFYLWSLFNT